MAQFHLTPGGGREEIGEEGREEIGEEGREEIGEEGREEIGEEGREGGVGGRGRSRREREE